MIRTDEDALICDLAETYHIYDYKLLPLDKVAVFAIGLRDDSRIKLRLANQRISNEMLLSAVSADALNLLVWSKTKDAQNNKNRPKSIVEAVLGKRENKKSNELLLFDSGEDFEKFRAAFLKPKGGEVNGD